MKQLLLYVFVCGVAGGAQASEELAKTLLDDFNKRADASRIVSQEQRNEVIRYVRDVKDDKIYGNHVSARILLVNLNDQEHIQKLFADFLQSENPMATRRAIEDLRRSSQVELIPMLAEYLNEGDDSIMYRDDNVGEIMLASYSISSGSISMEILSRSPDVPVEVREWASIVIEENRLGVDRRAIMRLWWPENKRHFETKEYDRLRPLAVVSPSENPPEDETIPAESSSGEPVAAENSIPPMTADPSSLPESTAHPAGNRLDELWLLVAAALAVLAAAAWMVRRRW